MQVAHRFALLTRSAHPKSVIIYRLVKFKDSLAIWLVDNKLILHPAYCY